MSWDKIDNLHKQKYGRSYISCHEPYEHDYLVGLILDHFPHLRKRNVELAIEHACKTMSTPRMRDEFLRCVEEVLIALPSPLVKEHH